MRKPVSTVVWGGGLIVTCDDGTIWEISQFTSGRFGTDINFKVKQITKIPQM